MVKTKEGDMVETNPQLVVNPLPIVSFGSKCVHPDVIDKDESGLSPRKIVTCACFLHHI